MSAAAEAFLRELEQAGDPEQAARQKRRFQTPERVVGINPAGVREAALLWEKGLGRFATLTELDGLFRSGVCEGRWAALELSLQRRPAWNKKWGGLFLRWARARDTSWHVTDRLGARLIGPLWLEGLIEPRQLAALALWPEVWPWRCGLTALVPSLEKSDADWSLLEGFLRAVLDEEGRFHAVRAAHNGVRVVLKAALKGCPARVRDLMDRHGEGLPSALAAVGAQGVCEDADY